jgi:hypothetical protein
MNAKGWTRRRTAKVPITCDYGWAGVSAQRRRAKGPPPDSAKLKGPDRMLRPGLFSRLLNGAAAPQGFSQMIVCGWRWDR